MGWDGVDPIGFFFGIPNGYPRSWAQIGALSPGRELENLDGLPAHTPSRYSEYPESSEHPEDQVSSFGKYKYEND